VDEVSSLRNKFPVRSGIRVYAQEAFNLWTSCGSLALKRPDTDHQHTKYHITGQIGPCFNIELVNRYLAVFHAGFRRGAQMARKGQTFRKTDLARALRAAKDAGIPIGGFEISKEGSIRIMTPNTPLAAPDDAANEWDAVK
jgi:hypothetical protein